ncbi:uncharacterized protein LACBIDRAFT_324794 [Laccaria bicolor S238N-H82]|uniref:Predicted protein n=1 Tax=Laccaria bicolor (strain S238N-H82 / ATCC MYA-4686) TaxID=486041 RepID=B0D325_LACBS|nr:uncharacterized protein LACBIDRAFT_324794 [Laccaria bicolor S238N-H82]EDR11199.1 predicted protein [Laccaria bicolor S238N-H82]|eukprot:XP_001878500.1 predicted protein [Laccaria bicolor S238N-H82]
MVPEEKEAHLKRHPLFQSTQHTRDSNSDPALSTQRLSSKELLARSSPDKFGAEASGQKPNFRDQAFSAIAPGPTGGGGQDTAADNEPHTPPPGFARWRLSRARGVRSGDAGRQICHGTLTAAISELQQMQMQVDAGRRSVQFSTTKYSDIVNGINGLRSVLVKGNWTRD